MVNKEDEAPVTDTNEVSLIQIDDDNAVDTVIKVEEDNKDDESKYNIMSLEIKHTISGKIVKILLKIFPSKETSISFWSVHVLIYV